MLLTPRFTFVKAMHVCKCVDGVQDISVPGPARPGDVALTQGCWRSVPRPGAARFGSAQEVHTRTTYALYVQYIVCTVHCTARTV